MSKKRNFSKIKRNVKKKRKSRKNKKIDLEEIKYLQNQTKKTNLEAKHENQIKKNSIKKGDTTNNPKLSSNSKINKNYINRTNIKSDYTRLLELFKKKSHINFDFKDDTHQNNSSENDKNDLNHGNHSKKNFIDHNDENQKLDQMNHEISEGHVCETDIHNFLMNRIDKNDNKYISDSLHFTFFGFLSKKLGLFPLTEFNCADSFYVYSHVGEAKLTQLIANSTSPEPLKFIFLDFYYTFSSNSNSYDMSKKHFQTIINQFTEKNDNPNEINSSMTSNSSLFEYFEPNDFLFGINPTTKSFDSSESSENILSNDCEALVSIPLGEFEDSDSELKPNAAFYLRFISSLLPINHNSKSRLPFFNENTVFFYFVSQKLLRGHMNFLSHFHIDNTQELDGKSASKISDLKKSHEDDSKIIEYYRSLILGETYSDNRKFSHIYFDPNKNSVFDGNFTNNLAGKEGFDANNKKLVAQNANASTGRNCFSVILNNPRLCSFFHYMNSYCDVLMTCQKNEGFSFALRYLCTFHIINHLRKTKRMIKQNNAEFHTFQGEQKTLSMKDISTLKNYQDRELKFRDQGFTKTKILILTPFASFAKQFIDIIIQLVNPRNVANKAKFLDEFGLTEEEEKEKLKFMRDKSPDFLSIFRGNNHDRFRIGLRIMENKVSLYSKFSSSDIIIASPLGLRLIVGDEKRTETEFDFLSSIEICIVDRSDIIKMQNWKFLKDIFSKLNSLPKTMNDCDIRRLRSWMVDGSGGSYRQNIILSDGRDVFFTSLLNSCKNHRGKIKLNVTTIKGYIENCINTDIQNVFKKIKCNTFGEAHQVIQDELLNSSTFNVVLKGLERVIVVVQTYMEYLCLWKAFKERCISFRTLHEHSSRRMMNFARQQFIDGVVNVLVVTERLLFYRRYRLRAAQLVIFLSPPYYPEIYVDLINNLEDSVSSKSDREYISTNASFCNIRKIGSICFYTEYDADRLERIVGYERVPNLLNAPDGKITVFKKN